MQYNSIAFRILRHFAHHPGLHRAVDIRQLCKAIDAEPGRAVHQRMTIDIIKRGKRDGWQITKTPEHTYWISCEEARRAMATVKRITREHFRVLREREIGAAA